MGYDSQELDILVVFDPQLFFDICFSDYGFYADYLVYSTSFSSEALS